MTNENIKSDGLEEGITPSSSVINDDKINQPDASSVRIMEAVFA